MPTKKCPVLDIKFLKASKSLKLPSFLNRIPAGFPSPADDYLEELLDLNDKLISNPASTYFVKVSGDSMTGAGIFSGDMLIVDRSKKPNRGSIVIALVNGDFTVKKLQIKGNQFWLMAENATYPPILISKEMQAEIWGVVTYVIHKPK